MVVRQACMHECSVAKSHVTLCDPKDCSPRGSSVRGISQARILEWVAFFFCRGFSQPRVSCITGGLFIPEPPGKPTSRCVCICKNKSIYTLKMSVLYHKLHTEPQYKSIHCKDWAVRSESWLPGEVAVVGLVLRPVPYSHGG